MLKKLTKLVTNNFGLKVAALFFSVVLWLVVVNIDDPTQAKNFTTSITITNSDYMTQQGKYFEAKDSNLQVTFKVSTVRSVMKNLSNTDFRAVADMENVEQVDGVYRVPIEITATRYASAVNFQGKTQYMEVNVEDLMLSQFSIKAKTVGDTAENYAVGDVRVSPNILKVTGPESVVNQIDHVEATIDVTGASADLTDSVVPVVYNANGEAVDTSKLSFNIDKVTISATILNIRNLSVEIEPSGTVADGFVCTGVTINPNKIAIKGTPEALNAAGSIVIPPDQLDISDATGNVVKTINISSYLPEDVEVVDSDNLNVEVTAVVEQVVSESYSVPVENIAIQNLKEGYEAAFAESTVTITLKGLRNDLDKLMADSIKGNVNAAGLAEGNHTVTVTLELDDSLYSVNGTQSAVITITKKAEDTSDTTNTGNDNGTHTGSNGGTETGTGSTNGNNTNNGNSEED